MLNVWISSQADPETLSKKSFPLALECTNLSFPLSDLFWFVHDPCLFYKDLQGMYIWRLAILAGSPGRSTGHLSLPQRHLPGRSPSSKETLGHFSDLNWGIGDGTWYRWFPQSKLNMSSWKGIILTGNFIIQASIFEGICKFSVGISPYLMPMLSAILFP